MAWRSSGHGGERLGGGTATAGRARFGRWLAAVVGCLGVLLAVVGVTTATSDRPTPSGDPVRAPAVAERGDGVLLTLVPGGSEARYRAQEQLTGRGFNEAVGSTREVDGSIVLDANGAIVPGQSRIVVDLRGLTSDSRSRDNYIQRNTLETARFPTADFVIYEAPGLPTPLPSSGEAAFQLTGDLTVHGVTRPSVWQVTAQFSEQEVVGAAATRVLMTDFGMTPPRAGPVLSIEDAITLEIQLRAAYSAELGATFSAVVLSMAAQPVADCAPTRPDALGPFYVPNAPMRDSVGSGYVLSGTVRAAGSCAPIPEAQVEFWLANPSGVYDDDHRATMLAGPEGEYRFESHPPPPYTGRPPHIHIRVSAPGYRTLVTQQYPQPGETEATFDLVLIPA